MGSLVVTIICTPFLMAGVLLWDGFVVMTLWNWFFPAAFGVPAITMPTAIVIGLIAPLLRPIVPRAKIKEEEKLWYLGQFTMVAFAAPGLALISGWIIKTWFA